MNQGLRPNVTKDAPLTPVTQEITKVLELCARKWGQRPNSRIFVCHMAMPTHISSVAVFCYYGRIVVTQTIAHSIYYLTLYGKRLPTHALKQHLWALFYYSIYSLLSFIQSSQGELTYLSGNYVSLDLQVHGPLMDKIKVSKVRPLSLGRTCPQ